MVKVKMSENISVVWWIKCAVYWEAFWPSGGRNRLYKNSPAFTPPKPGCFQIPNTRIQPSHRIQPADFFLKVQVSQPDSSKWWWQQTESCGRGAFCTLWVIPWHDDDEFYQFSTKLGWFLNSDLAKNQGVYSHKVSPRIDRMHGGSTPGINR